jgi:hypothetical protein
MPLACPQAHAVSHCRRARRTCGRVALMLRGLLCIVAAVLGTSMPLKAEHKVGPQVVPQTRVDMVHDETLPPVLQQIAQCESHGPLDQEQDEPARHTESP